MFGDYLNHAPGIWLGGIIIELRGGAAIVHHGGYEDDDGRLVTAPFQVSWHTEGPNMVFDLQGWKCRIMQAQEGHRYVDMPASPIHTVDGTFTIDWTWAAEKAPSNPPAKKIDVWFA